MNLSDLRLVILDRDGVLNEDRASGVRHLDECRWLEGAAAAVARLHQAGFLTAVATNQANVARGLLHPDELARIHADLLAQVQALGGDIDAIAVCPHDDALGCACRKPKPGLLVELAQQLGVPAKACLFIGDDLRDQAAAAAFGCEFVRVETGKDGHHDWPTPPTWSSRSLAAWVSGLLSRRTGQRT